MRYFSLTVFIAILLTVLVGCQTFSGVPVMGFSRNSDSAITESVNRAFMNNPQLNGIPIRIEAQNGAVQLSGYVKTIRQSDVASDVASKVDGVKSVENNLIVRK